MISMYFDGIQFVIASLHHPYKQTNIDRQKKLNTEENKNLQNTHVFLFDKQLD